MNMMVNESYRMKDRIYDQLYLYFKKISKQLNYQKTHSNNKDCFF